MMDEKTQNSRKKLLCHRKSKSFLFSRLGRTGLLPGVPRRRHVRGQSHGVIRNYRLKPPHLSKKKNCTALALSCPLKWFLHKCQPINLAKLKFLCFMCVEKYVVLRKNCIVWMCIVYQHFNRFFLWHFEKNLNSEKTPNSSDFLWKLRNLLALFMRKKCLKNSTKASTILCSKILRKLNKRQLQ